MDSHTKFSKFCFVSSLLSPSLKKKERTRTEKRKQSTMYRRKLKLLKLMNQKTGYKLITK